MIQRVWMLMVAFGLAMVASSQTVKEISVSQETSFTDHLSLKKDARDMDLMVKFVFDEDSNTLTVNLISYRSLFVFWDQVRYRPVISSQRKIRLDKLPYIAECDKGTQFRISKSIKRAIKWPRKNYVFNRWITYEGLQPVPQDYKMVNDYISQSFDIQSKRSQVSVTLRDVFLMEHVKSSTYELFSDTDLNIRYQITIMRNPCFGREEDIKSAKESQDGVAAAYASIKKKYGKGKVASEESLKLFQEMHDLLCEQFPRKDIRSDCPDAQALWDSYNLYADSISRMTCIVTVQEPSAATAGIAGFLPKDLLQKSKQIDQLVSRWLKSNDSMERNDLMMLCEGLVKDCNLIIAQGAFTEEQKKALAVFCNAERYFNKMCKQIK